MAESGKERKSPPSQSQRTPGEDKIEGQDSAESQSLSLGHISKNQVTALIAFVLGVKALLITPTFLILQSATAAWIVVVISVAVASAGLAGWVKWSRLTPGTPFYAALKKTLGTTLGTIVCALMMLSFTIAISFSMRLFAGGAAIGLLPEFPVEALLLVLIAASGYAAWLGPESIGRASTFFLVPTLATFFVVALSALKGHDARNLLPLLGPGPGVVALQGVLRSGLWGIMASFAALKPYVRSEEDLARGARNGLYLAGFGLLVSVVAILMFFPYPASTRLSHPMGMLARAVYLNRFLQRIEAAFAFSWFYASAIQASFIYFVLLSMLAEVSGTRTYRPFLPALATLTFGIGALPVSLLRAEQLLETYFFNTFGLAFVPFGWLLYAVAKLRGVKPAPRSSPSGGDGVAGNTREEGKPSTQDSG